jgi:CubicO group peptidase (beta-lactamase class C family)
LSKDYWPTQDWRKADPESVGMCGDLLSNLDRDIRTYHRSITALLVVRRGDLICERYYGGFGQDDKHLLASVTKSVISALIGIAIDRGFIEGVDQRVLDFFPEYSPGLREHLKLQLTIRHLLTMTAGFQWRTGARNHELYIDRLRRSKDWVAFIQGLPIQERLMGSFQYNSATSHLLSAIITRSTGRCAQEFATEYLFAPLGMDPPATNMPHTFSQADVFRNTGGGWPKDPQGNSMGGWGLMLKPRDMARFGYLYIKGGQWEGEQIISKEWIDDSITAHTPEYGYQWWLRDVKGVFVFSAVGQGGNHIFCIPQEDLVVVIASRLGSRWQDRWLLLEQFILPAVLE